MHMHDGTAAIDIDSIYMCTLIQMWLVHVACALGPNFDHVKLLVVFDLW